jgi:sarcosine oxidase subunit beta
MAYFQPAPAQRLRLERILSDSRSCLYLRPEGGIQMFVGWREGDRIRGDADLEAADPDNYRQTANYKSLTDMHHRLTSTLPFMREGFAHRTYACVYDYTPDGMPVLGEAEAVQGLYFALGFSGGGFSLSPWVGRVMAHTIVNGAAPPEMELLSLARFREGRMLVWSNASSADSQSDTTGTAAATEAE